LVEVQEMIAKKTPAKWLLKVPAKKSKKPPAKKPAAKKTCRRNKMEFDF
jgi:hypothetical protein